MNYESFPVRHNIKMAIGVLLAILLCIATWLVLSFYASTYSMPNSMGSLGYNNPGYVSHIL